MTKEAIKKLVAGNELTFDEAAQVMDEMFSSPQRDQRITINESAAVQVRDTVVRQRAVTRVPSRVRVIRVS